MTKDGSALAENKAALRRAIASFNNPEARDGYFQLYAENCVLHGYQGVEPGMKSIKQFYTAFWAAFPDAQLTIEDILSEEDKLACRFSVRGTHRGNFNGIAATGKPVTIPGITILRFQNGKCVERWSQSDFLSLHQQLGVVPIAQ